MKLITFSHWGEYLCVGLLFCYFFFSKSKEMQIKNRIMVNWANLVKVYLGHVLLQSGCLKYYFHLLFLTSWKTLMKSRECILLHHHVLSAFHHVFQLKAWHSNTTPAAGPFLGDCVGSAAWEMVMPLEMQTFPSPKRCFPLNPRGTE